MMQAPPSPCSTRAAANSGSPVDSAHNAEAPTNTTSPIRHRLAAPTISPSEATGSSAIRLASW